MCKCFTKVFCNKSIILLIISMLVLAFSLIYFLKYYIDYIKFNDGYLCQLIFISLSMFCTLLLIILKIPQIAGFCCRCCKNCTQDPCFIFIALLCYLAILASFLCLFFIPTTIIQIFNLLWYFGGNNFWLALFIFIIPFLIITITMISFYGYCMCCCCCCECPSNCEECCSKNCANIDGDNFCCCKDGFQCCDDHRYSCCCNVKCHFYDQTSLTGVNTKTYAGNHSDDRDVVQHELLFI